MKKMLVAAALLLGTSQAYAAPCASGSLADYIGLGAGGCQIGSNTLSGFTTLPVSFGATEIAASAIGVVPVLGGPFGFGLDFLVNRSASAGELLEFLVGYSVQGPSISGARVHIDDASALGNAGVTAVKDLCLEGIFTGFPSCSGTPATLIAVQNEIVAVLSEEESFSPVTSLAVVDDIVIDSGGTGSASLAVAGNRFASADIAAVPVPATAALFALGVLCFGLTSIRGRRRGAV